MKRREFIGFAGIAALAAGCARAADNAGDRGDERPLAARFGLQFRPVSHGLVLSGYFEGENLAVEYRWAEGQYD